MKYDERATEQLTSQRANSSGKVSGSARKQAGATQRSKHIVIDARIRRASTGRPVDRLLEHLQTLHTDYRFTVLLEPNDPWISNLKNFSTATFPYKQFSFNPIKQLTAARQLYKLKPDLVHFTLSGQQPVLYFGKQITFTHDLTMFKYARPGRRPAWLHWFRMMGYRFIMWQGHRKALRIIVPTEYVRDAVAKYYLFTNRKITVTLEASEPPIADKAVAPDFAPEKFIFYVGSSFPHKNLDRLIEAFELLKETHPDLKLILAGKREWHAKKLRKWAKNKPHFHDIIFAGFVSEAELKWLYQNALAYVFPSLSEGFGLPGLEAMVHGCPVASSNATCLPEVHGDAAEYFDPEDITDMAVAIDKVISSKPLREKLIAAGYAQSKKFSWKRMAEQTLEVYRQVLDD